MCSEGGAGYPAPFSLFVRRWKSISPCDKPMPRFTVLIHTRENDATRLGRTLETLRSSDEIIVVDQSPDEETQSVTRTYGARYLRSIPGVQPGAHAVDSRNDWILCIQPSEAIGEELEASLLEFARDKAPDDVAGFAVHVREELNGEWRELAPELRLVDRTKINWTDTLPPNVSHADVLRGHLLRFAEPSSTTAQS